MSTFISKSSPSITSLISSLDFSRILLTYARLFVLLLLIAKAFRPRVKISWKSSSVYITSPLLNPYPGMGIITVGAVWEHLVWYGGVWVSEVWWVGVWGRTVEPSVYTGLNVKCIAHIRTSLWLLTYKYVEGVCGTLCSHPEELTANGMLMIIQSDSGTLTIQCWNLFIFMREVTSSQPTKGVDTAEDNSSFSFSNSSWSFLLVLTAFFQTFWTWLLFCLHL